MVLQTACKLNYTTSIRPPIPTPTYHPPGSGAGGGTNQALAGPPAAGVGLDGRDHQGGGQSQGTHTHLNLIGSPLVVTHYTTISVSTVSLQYLDQKLSVPQLSLTLGDGLIRISRQDAAWLGSSWRSLL